MRGNPPQKKKKSEIAKKNLGRGDFGGSVGAQQTDKILRMALSCTLSYGIYCLVHIYTELLVYFVLYTE